MLFWWAPMFSEQIRRISFPNRNDISNDYLPNCSQLLTRALHYRSFFGVFCAIKAITELDIYTKVNAFMARCISSCWRPLSANHQKTDSDKLIIFWKSKRQLSKQNWKKNLLWTNTAYQAHILPKLTSLEKFSTDWNFMLRCIQVSLFWFARVTKGPESLNTEFLK